MLPSSSSESDARIGTLTGDTNRSVNNRPLSGTLKRKWKSFRMNKNGAILSVLFVLCLSFVFVTLNSFFDISDEYNSDSNLDR